MKQRTDSQGVPYSYLVDNIKVVLIFLVVFNHLIAFQLVKVDMVVRYVWYGITIFHMPAFIFISGYLSKKPQDVLKNVKNLLIPYILGYSLTWYAYIWTGRSMDYELLRPSGTVMWYVLALFIYRLTIEALGKIRFIVPLSIIFALWAGTRPEFTTYLSSSRIVVFFPFFVAGYLWKSDYTKIVRKFKGKWVLVPISGLLLYGIPNFMIANEMPVDILRGNHSYQVSGMDDVTGMLIRLLMYLVSFVLVLTFLALIPDVKLPVTFVGRNTMGIYFFHYPIMIIMNGLYILMLPAMNNVWVLLGVSLVFVLVLGSLPVDLLYTGVLNLIAFILIKKLLTEDVYKDLPDKLNLVIVPMENVDGAAIHYELQKEHPTWKFHVARFNSLGKEFYYEHFQQDTIHSEAMGLTRIYDRYVPDMIVDNHGVPSHEWEQQFSGYTSPSYKGFWLPRSLLYGYFWYVTNPEYKDNYPVNKVMEDVIADKIAEYPEMRELNREWSAQFEKYAHAWMPKLFPANYYKEMINYWIPFAADPNHRYPSIRFPWITTVAYTSEVADETAQGEYLNLCARAHVAHDEATIRMLMEAVHVMECHLEEQDGQILTSYIRQRPMIVKVTGKNK